MVSQAGGLALAGDCCRWCTRSRASSRPGPTSRSTTTRPSARRSSTSARSPGCCRAGRATRTSRCATSRRCRAVPGLEMIQPASRGRGGAGGGLLLSTATEASCYLRLVSIPCRVPYRAARRLTGSSAAGASRSPAATTRCCSGTGRCMLAEAYDAAGAPARAPWLRSPGREPALAQPGGRRLAGRRDVVGDAQRVHARRSLRPRRAGGDGGGPPGGDRPAPGGAGAAVRRPLDSCLRPERRGAARPPPGRREPGGRRRRGCTKAARD